MTAQLSPMRLGRVTGSRVPAILGVSKYSTRDDVMREMTRQFFGDPAEFQGNEATRWGNDLEETARAEYERVTGSLVLDAQEFVTHPDYPWLGISPDGLLDGDGLVEFKAPYRARYRSISEKPEYAAQVQAQLACTGRAWAHFVIFRVGEPLIIELVAADPDWLPANIGKLADFYAEFQAVIADPVLAAPYRAPLQREDTDWLMAATEYRQRLAVHAEASAALEDAKARLVELAGESSVRGCGVSVTRSQVAGSVDWKAVAGKHAPDADVELFRKAGSVRVSVREAE